MAIPKTKCHNHLKVNIAAAEIQFSAQALIEMDDLPLVGNSVGAATRPDDLEQLILRRTKAV